MDLSLEFAGLRLRNPVIVAAGPWSRNGAAIQRAMDAGAAAVVTSTVTLEAARSPSPHLFLGGGQAGQEGQFNTMLYSDMQLERWEREVERLHRGDCCLIVSIWGSSPSELGYLAGRAERMGADALEVSISAPLGTRNELLSGYPREIREYLQAAVEAVEIPVLVKLSYEAANARGFLASLSQAGVRGVTAIDSLKGLSGVDLETCRARMPTYGGYSGAPIRPVALATVATLRQLTDLPICGCGGIRTAEEALEFLMLGAGAVQLASGILREGCGLISRVVEDLERWLEDHGYPSAEAVVGRALDSLRPFEDIPRLPLAVRLTGRCDGCGRCVKSCLYDALCCTEAGLTVHAERCGGCGMCAAVCPSLTMDWKRS